MVQTSVIADARVDPKEPRSTVLTIEKEAIVVALRQHTLLPLNDCLYGLQPTIPYRIPSSVERDSREVASRVRRQHLWDRLRVFTNGGWLVHRSP